MTERQRFILVNEVVRRNCLEAVRCADIGSAVSIGPSTRSLDQNSRMWASLADIARSKPEGRQWTVDTWKAAFLHCLGHQVMFAEGLDNSGPFPIGFRSSKLNVKQMADLITCIQEYGDRHGVVWTEVDKHVIGYEDALSRPSGSTSNHGSIDEAADSSTSLPVAASSPLSDLEWLKTVARMLYAVANEGWGISILEDQKRAIPSGKNQTEETRAKARKIYAQCEKVVRGEVPRLTALRFIVNIAGCKQSEVEGTE